MSNNTIYISQQQFVSEIKRKNLSRKSRYNVYIQTPPDILRREFDVSGNVATFSTSNTDVAKALTLTCESINLPGVQLLTDEYRTYGGAPMIKIPKTRVYDDFSCSFLIQNDFLQKSYFESWMNSINSFSNNNIGYFNEFITSILIQVFDDTDLSNGINFNHKIKDMALNWGRDFLREKFPTFFNAPVLNEYTSRIPFINGVSTFTNFQPSISYQIELINAYPTRVESVPVSWIEVDQVYRVSVVISYEQIRYMRNYTQPIFEHTEKTF